MSSWIHPWYYDGWLQRLKLKLLRPLTYKVHGVRQNHVATCIRWHVCLCMFEFVPEALTFIYTFRLGNTPKSMAWAPTYLAYIPIHPARNSTQPIYIPIRYTSAYITYTWHTHTHTHTHTHNLANWNPIYTITHRNIHKQTLGIYTYTHDKYTTSCRYTYTRTIYTYALSIDNYTPGNYKYRLSTYNMIIYTTA